MTDISKEAVERLSKDIQRFVPWGRGSTTLPAMSARIEELEAQVAAARNEALREAAEVAEEFADEGMDADAVYNAILALMEEPTND